MDARLELPESEFSYVLQDWAGTHFVEEAFDRSAETLGKILGFSLSVDSLERISRKMGESVADFRQSLTKPPAKEEGEILVATADGKGVPMRRPADQRPVGARRKKGEKANKKQMATIGCVYTVDPKHRTAEDVVEALFRERSAGKRNKAAEPVAQHKRVWSSLTYEQGDTLRRRRNRGVHLDGPRGQAAATERPAGGLPDGRPTELVGFVRGPFAEARVEILDLLHAIDYLWKAAYLFHAEGSAEASTFVRDRILRLLHGEVGYVIGGLRQMATKREQLPAAKQRRSRSLQLPRRQSPPHVLRRIPRSRLPDRQRRDRGSVPPSGQGSNGEVGHALDDRRCPSHARSPQYLNQRSMVRVLHHRIQAETKRLTPNANAFEHLTFQLAL